jgi:hypothetical protein
MPVYVNLSHQAMEKKPLQELPSCSCIQLQQHVKTDNVHQAHHRERFHHLTRSAGGFTGGLLPASPLPAALSAAAGGGR